MEQDIATQVVGLGGATDFSLWKLFLRADFVVKWHGGAKVIGLVGNIEPVE